MIVIYGPPASGKSHNAQAFCKKYGLSKVIEHEDYPYRKKWFQLDSNDPTLLVLTIMPKDKCAERYPHAELINIDTALSQIGQKRPQFVDGRWIAA